MSDLSLKDALLRDMKASMKEKDVLRKDTIQIVRAGVLQIEKDSQTQLDDPGVIRVITKEVQKRLDVLPDYERAGRQDLVDNAHRQIDILKSYLPESLTEDELRRLVDEAIKESGSLSVKDMGKAIKLVAEKASGRADGKTISELVRKALSDG
ncbi:MAG: GatB/YqeY domain-containing protein [Clostridiales bacterium]|jgi:uncharacterized protein YqeY|nr:GatB/YqeY domain-containing protein [Clostridiales bacterium]